MALRRRSTGDAVKGFICWTSAVRREACSCVAMENEGRRGEENAVMGVTRDMTQRSESTLQGVALGRGIASKLDSRNRRFRCNAFLGEL
jgi:hypothetical protein